MKRPIFNGNLITLEKNNTVDAVLIENDLIKKLEPMMNVSKKKQS